MQSLLLFDDSGKILLSHEIKQIEIKLLVKKHHSKISVIFYFCDNEKVVEKNENSQNKVKKRGCPQATSFAFYGSKCLLYGY